MFLDKTFFGLCGLTLLTRLILQPSLISIESMGREHMATLINSLIIFILGFLFFLKKTILREKIKLPKVLLPLACFCVIASLSIFYSIDAPSSLLYIFDLWTSLLFMLILINLMTSIKSIQMMMGMLIALMTIACAHAAFEYLHLSAPALTAETDRGIVQLLMSHRTPTIFGWPNILAGFIVMILPLCIASLIQTRLRLFKVILFVVILLGLYSLMITMTISSWISIFFEAVILFMILKQRSFSPKIKNWSLLIIILIALMIFSVAIKKMSLPGVNSTDARLQYTTSSWQLIKLHPWVGSGWRSYGVASFNYIKDINGRSNFAHNSYLQICCELGVIGLIPFLSFLWMLGRSALLLVDEQYLQNRWLIAAVIAAIFGCMVDNLFSYTMLKPQVSLFWWVLCALLIALQEGLAPSSFQFNSQGTWKKMLLVIALFGGIVTVRLTMAENDFFTAVQKIHQGTQLDKAVSLCLEAKGLNPWDKKFDLARAYALYSEYLSNHDPTILRQADEAVLLTRNQVSLGFEREALLKKINDSAGRHD